jgi:hypothetical protein
VRTGSRLRYRLALYNGFDVQGVTRLAGEIHAGLRENIFAVQQEQAHLAID